jgi:hypothetical protein
LTAAILPGHPERTTTTTTTIPAEDGEPPANRLARRISSDVPPMRSFLAVVEKEIRAVRAAAFASRLLLPPMENALGESQRLLG